MSSLQKDEMNVSSHVNVLESAVADEALGFYFTWESNKKVWTIGRDIDDTANAVIAGKDDCPAIIEIPRNFSYEGYSGPVEIVGRKAFNWCARHSYYLTHTVFVTKQVKVIRYLGFGAMNYLKNFTIEPGSQLEVIEGSGLHAIGSVAQSSLSKVLMLPSSLYSIGVNGIYYCNSFTDVIYCGTNDLSENSSILNTGDTPIIDLRVSIYYPSNSLLGRTVNRSENIYYRCTEFEGIPLPTKTPKQTCIIIKCNLKMYFLLSLAFTHVSFYYVD